MSWIKNLGTVLASFAFSFLVAEIGFRALDIGYGNSPLLRSKTYHHVHPSDYIFLMHDPNGEYGGFNIYYDESGYRVSDPSKSNILSEDSAHSLLFLGDSFTEGNQVPFEETFPAKIGNAFDSPILNFGVSSYSPILYSLQTKYQINALSAELVILQIYANDFNDDQIYRSSAIYDEATIVGIDGGQSSFLSNLARQSYLLRFVRKSQLLVMHILTNSSSDQASSLDADDSVFEYEQQIERDNLLFTSSMIENIGLELAKHGKHLAVFMIPSKSLSQKRICCEEDKLYAMFINEMQSRNITVLDVAKYFQDFEPQEILFFETDIHLTATGHDVLATAIIEEINSLGLIN